MNDVVRALGIAAGTLLSVVVLIVVITIAVVKRGEHESAERPHELPDDSLHVKETAPSQPAKSAKAAAAASDEISVPTILLLGIGLFTLTILLLLGLSLLQHMS